MIGQYSENDRIWVETGDVAVPIGKRRFPTWQISSRPASPEDGEFGLNTETDAIEVYDDADSEWKTYKQNSDSDHGELQGLSDDDHSQYLLLAGRGGQTIDDTITINDDLWVNNNNANSKVFLGALPSTPATYSGLWFGQSTPVDNNYTFLASNQNAFLNVPSGGLLEIRVGNSTTPGSGQMARIGDFGGGNYCFDITDRLYVTTNNSSWAAAVIEQDYDAAGNSIILDLRNSTQAMIAGVYSDGRALFPTQSFPATVGDKVSLYDNYLGTASNYGYGVEPNYLYFKAGSGIGGFRWYINANADGGTSDYMELSVYGLTVNRPTTINGNTTSTALTVNETSTGDVADFQINGSTALKIDINNNVLIPTGDLHIGTPPTGYEDYELTVKSTSGGIVFQRTGTSEPFVYLFNETAGSGCQMRGLDSGGGYLTGSSYDLKVIQWNDDREVGIGGVSPYSGTTMYVFDDIGTGVPAKGNSHIDLEDDATAAKGVGGSISLRGNYTGSTSATSLCGIRAFKTNATSGNYDFSLAFSTREHGSTQSYKMFLTGAGNLIIGTTDPEEASERLHIKGNLFLHSDNDEILLGAGKDVGISYDGTDMKIVTNKVNASDLVIDCGTDKTVELTETVYEDLRTPLAQARVPAVAAPDWAKFKDDGAGSTGVYAWHFDPNSVEQLYFTIQFPHSIKEGADVYPHIHWCPTDSNTGNVVWAIEYTWQDINGTFGNTSTTTVTAAADGTAYKHQVASFGAFTGKNISSIVVCRIYRDATNPNDTYPSDAVALEFDCHYQVNTLGSRQEFTK